MIQGVTYEDELHLEVHYGSDLVESDVLVVIQDMLIRRAPKVAGSLEVHGFERDPDLILVDLADPRSLSQAVVTKGVERGEAFADLARRHGAARYPRRFGSVLLRGRGAGTGGLRMAIDFDAHVPARAMGTNWLWSNTVSFSVSSSRVYRSERQDWIVGLVAELVERTSVLWGAAYLNGEFRQSNLHNGPDGMWAIGRDMRTSLPGLFWLNIFGAPYVALFGESRLITVPSHQIDQRKGQVILRAYEDAQTWPSQVDVKRSLIAAIGPDFFFDRNDPDRPHRSPDFGLRDLEPAPALRVLTDGETYTELP